MDGDVKALFEEIEGSFGIKFRSDELTDDSYLSDLYNAVRSHVLGKPSEKCFTSIVFWRLRRSCVGLFGIEARSIAPSTPIELVLPTKRRRRAWLALGRATGLKLPGLEYSSALGHAFWWGSLVPCVVLAVTHRGGWWLVLAIVLRFVSVQMFFRLARPLADILPYHCRTLGDLTKTVVGLNYGALTRQLGAARETETIEAVRYVITDPTGIEPDALVEENPRLIDLVLANDGFRVQV